MINYKKELEIAAKNMILVHEPDVLIRMIVRMIVQKVRVSHAGILLYQRERDTYVLSVSRGMAGLKIPSGFARVDSSNPLIRIFSDAKKSGHLHKGAVIYSRLGKMQHRYKNTAERAFIKQVIYQMDLFGAVVCIPSYFRSTLMGLLLLGNKKRGKSEFKDDELDFFVALASDVAVALRNAQLFYELEVELDRNRRLFFNTTVALAAAIDAKDHYTHGHTSRVTNLSMEIAKRIGMKRRKFIDEEFIEHLQIAGLLHDIGKIGIPESILNKDGPLTPEEQELMKVHPLKGVAILQPIRELEKALVGVKYHHERYDGSGYPEGLEGNQIPLLAAIIAVADSFDAMTTDRPYRRGLSKAKAIDEIQGMKGRQFNPVVVDAMVELYKNGKI